MKKTMNVLFCLSAVLMNSGLFADEVANPPRDQGFGQTLVMIAIALAFFYLILWRPEQKRKKELDKQRNEMKKGDRVTAMGIIGTIVKIQDNTVIVRMVDGSKLEFLKAAINEVLPATDEDLKRTEKEEKVLKKTDFSDEV